MFRRSKISLLCSICSVRTTASCLRCARPLCSEHAPATLKRCDQCEAEYLRSFKHGVTDLDPGWLLYVGILVVLQLGSALAFPPLSLGKAAFVSLLWWVLGFPVYLLRARFGRTLRRLAFLGQRRARRE